MIPSGVDAPQRPEAHTREGGRERTRFSRAVTAPSESMMALSPRSWVTFPTMMTVLPVKASRYCELMRGVDTESAMAYARRGGIV